MITLLAKVFANFAGAEADLVQMMHKTEQILRAFRQNIARKRSISGSSKTQFGAAEQSRREICKPEFVPCNMSIPVRLFAKSIMRL